MVSRAQLLDLGLSPSAIRHRMATARLHPLHSGVYAVGHAVLAPLAREWAAILACGPGALVCCVSAAVVWGLLAPQDEVVHVAVARRRRRPQGAIVVHELVLEPRDRLRRDGLPITTATRTLLDLAACAPPRVTERAVEEALVRRLVRHDELLARAAGRRGAQALRTAALVEPTLTRSEAERRLLALVRRAELPRPQTNVEVLGFEVDALWVDRRLVVEVDGYAYHATRAAFERDRQRDGDLRAAGYRVERLTWRMLAQQPERVVARLAAALAR